MYSYMFMTCDSAQQICCCYTVQFHAGEFILRDLQNHKHYLTLIDGDSSGRHSTTYGINGTSPLLNLSGFDVTKSFPFDIMHSIFEGVARRHLNFLLHHVIDNCHCFSLSQMNHIIKSHPYGYSEADTKPMPVDRQSTTTSDFHFTHSGTCYLTTCEFQLHRDFCFCY